MAYTVRQGPDRYGPYEDLRIALVVADALPQHTSGRYASAGNLVTVVCDQTGQSYYNE